MNAIDLKNIKIQQLKSITKILEKPSTFLDKIPGKLWDSNKRFYIKESF